MEKSPPQAEIFGVFSRIFFGNLTFFETLPYQIPKFSDFGGTRNKKSIAPGLTTKRTNNFPKNVPELKSPPSIIRGDSYDFTSNTIVMIEWSQLLCLPVKSLFKLIDCLWSVSAVPEAEGSYLDCQVKRTCKNTILKSLFTISVAIDLFAHNCVDKSK